MSPKIQNIFKSSSEYTYDSNGNLIEDKNRGVSGISYNVLNLPCRIAFNNNRRIETLYRADGVKLSSEMIMDNQPDEMAIKTLVPGVVAEAPAAGDDAAVISKESKSLIANAIDTKTYIGNYEFSGDSLTRFNTPYGYFLHGHFYVIDYDYQGNHKESGGNYACGVAQENRYYPYGLPISGGGNTQYTPYLFGSKEFEDRQGLNIYDFGARTYVPDECRFWQPDPKAHDYHWLSPYAYCGGDPINRVDPDGCDWVSRIVNGVTEYYYDRDITSQEFADQKYGNEVVTYIPDGHTISINGVDFTFNNDLVDNKYGTVSIGGVVQDNSRIIYGEDYTIFGTSDNSCNAETLHKNILGTSYTGPNNPLDYERRYTYQYRPRNRSELGSIVHDKAYDSAGAEGVLGALFNVSETVVVADAKLLKYNLMNIYYSPSYKDKFISMGTAVVFYEILLRKYPIYVGRKLYNSAKSFFK